MGIDGFMSLYRGKDGRLIISEFIAFTAKNSCRCVRRDLKGVSRLKSEMMP